MDSLELLKLEGKARVEPTSTKKRNLRSYWSLLPDSASWMVARAMSRAQILAEIQRDGMACATKPIYARTRRDTSWPNASNDRRRGDSSRGAALMGARGRSVTRGSSRQRENGSKRRLRDREAMQWLAARARLEREREKEGKERWGR